MSKPLVLVCVCAFVASALPAQKAIDAKTFLPADYRNVVFVDFATMRKKGIWDELESSVLKAAFKQIEKESGFALKALDRMTGVAVVPVGDASERPANEAPDHTEIFVLEGNAPLAMPEWVRQNMTEEQVGGYTTRVRGGRMSRLYVTPKPELLVWGSQAILRPALEGKASAGLPSADVMSLLSGRNDSLAYMVLDTRVPLLRQRFLGSVFPDAQWAEDEVPTFLCLRVLATGDADDPHLVIEAVLRHATAGAGMDVSAKAADALLERLVAMPEMRAAKAALQRVEKKRDRGDLVYTVDLGRARDAIGTLAVLVMPIVQPPGGEVQVRVEAAPAAPAAPAEPAKPKK